MDGKTYITESFKLRSSGVVPIAPGKFIVQTFGVDKNELKNYEATTVITESDDFIGANVEGLYMSANFQRLPYFNESNQYIFSGNTVGKTEFVDESNMPGQG